MYIYIYMPATHSHFVPAWLDVPITSSSWSLQIPSETNIILDPQGRDVKLCPATLRWPTAFGDSHSLNEHHHCVVSNMCKSPSKPWFRGCTILGGRDYWLILVCVWLPVLDMSRMRWFWDRLTPSCRLNHPDALQPTPSLCGFIFLDVFNGLQNHTLW